MVQKKTRKRIIVTGSSGFIGINLCNKLIANGHHVIGIDKFASQEQNESLEFIEGSIVDLYWHHIWDLCPSEIIHLAGPASIAESFMDVYNEVEQSVLLTSFLIEKMRQRPGLKLMFVSSAAVYGNHSILKYHEDLRCNPISPYGVCKLASENLIRICASAYGFEYIIVRPFSIYGFGLRKQVIYDITMRFLTESKAVVVNGTGRERRDFVHVDDCCAIMSALLDKPSWSDDSTFNIGTGRGVTLKRVVDLIYKFTGANMGYRFMGKDQPGNPISLVANTDKLNTHGIGCTIGIEEGLRDTVSKIMVEYFSRSGGQTKP